MLILGFGCKVNGHCASDNGLALWWQLVAGSGVFGMCIIPLDNYLFGINDSR